MYNKVKTAAEIEAIRESGKMLATVLQKIEAFVDVGVTGKQVDELASRELKKLGGAPAFLGYQGFPGSVCISLNDAVVHGIPNDTPFKDGDVIGFDFGVIYKGMVTDAARTFVVGEVSGKLRSLLTATQRSLDDAINVVKDGCTVGDIASSAQRALDEKGYGIVRDLVGHGVGHNVHEEPEIPNQGVPGTGPMLKSGMTIAIEPMSTLGDWRVVMDPDGWTIRTRDGSLSAHFEDTILVTDQGAEILTRL
ncbi:MAG: methionyl aminopeptidase [Candidatus Saccharimonadales bacterium]|jgi:methionyl aminopeptidase